MAIRCIFESHIPAWSNPTILAQRLDLWQRASINTVMLLADSGGGVTWKTSLAPYDARINEKDPPLSAAVDQIHRAGLQVYVCVNVMGIYQLANPIKPEYLLSDYSEPFYDVWNSAFRAWRRDYIKSCVESCDADGLALDYIRSGREQLSESITAGEAVMLMLQAIRSATPEGLPIVNTSSTSFNATRKQGVHMDDWLAAGVVDACCLTNYNTPYPLNEITPLPDEQVWLMSGNYEVVNGAVVPRKGLVVGREWRRMKRLRPNLAGYGLYLSNLFTADQANALGTEYGTV